MKKQPSSPAQVATASPGLRRFLYFTAGLTGAAILVIEILGAKILSPYLGASHFVWTAQISVTLIALAAGYFFGGWLVDRSPRLERLYACIAAAGCYLCLALLLVQSAAYAFIEWNLAVSALFTSALLFFVPLTLLAAVGPFAIRVLAISMAEVGGQVGRLSAISTLGSVLGAMLIGYVILPLAPNSVTLYSTAGVLILIAAVWFGIWGRKSQLRLPLILLAVISLALGAAGLNINPARHWDWAREIHRENSNFGLLQVIETKDGGRRFYLNDYLTQNTYDPATKQSLSLFTYMLKGLADAYASGTSNVLCIGLGIGIVPQQFAQHGARVRVVEINPAAIPLAAHYFHLETNRMEIVVGDGRYFVNKTEEKFDAIILDAFLGDSSPSHLMTREAFTAMRRILKPDGALVINSFGDFTPGRDFFTASLDKTLRAVFPSVRIHAASRDHGNVFFVASPRERMAPVRPFDFAAVPGGIRAQAEAAFANVLTVEPQNGQVLTDDHNPVEYYDAENREELRRRLALYMREM